MIPPNCLQAVTQLALIRAQETYLPPEALILLTNEAGKRLAKELGANANVVLLGTCLMDYMLAQAVSEGKRKEHIAMAEAEATRILGQYPEISPEEKDEVLWCIREHHGVKQFHSLESEICCNADCYKFLSVKGLLGVMLGSKRSYEETVDMIRGKVEEKWHALSLPVCKQELTLQYKAIKSFLSHL